MFTDRTDAGRRLAEALQHHRGENAVVLALPRGGVPVAVEIARALAAPLDLLIVRKIGVPEQPELAMGAVVDGADPIVVRNEDVLALTGVSDETFDAVCATELAEIERRRARYLADRKPTDVAGRIAIVVDDGLATGATMRAGLRALAKRQPKRIVLAVPVAPPDTLDAMRREADEVVCLETPAFFSAIGSHYRDFTQVEDAEVVAALSAAVAK
jgi:putative phosphoribosyl transferase